eukprot:CAMPEP_0170611684 /NCGR_PEP_ID=MMETSP0224-20130122/23319_1 /TAXON_ID=285029 /ORGANISM="Togula jolla, Strain CCCM 725" /LENGTH=363 /DNA_ID=CAMNT_0010937133 /DNA_START=45 /DNA_END=1136 /DNA_ORIENTATION=-
MAGLPISLIVALWPIIHGLVVESSLLSRSSGSSLSVMSRRSRGKGNASLDSNWEHFVGCPKQPASRDRTWLRLVVANNHGSTALESVLMSSPKLATLCSAEVWQCEGRKLLERTFQKNPDLVPMDQVLETFSETWDLNRSVFLDKQTQSFPQLEGEDDVVRNTLPRRMKAHGIEKLRPAYIIMYKPLCLWTLSHLVTKEVFKDPRAVAKFELKRLQQQVQVYEKFASQGRAPLVLNYAHLIWHPDFAKQRLERYLPCLGSLDMDFVPEEVPGTGMKITMGTQSYGNTFEPVSCCGWEAARLDQGFAGKCMRSTQKGTNYSSQALVNGVNVSASLKIPLIDLLDEAEQESLEAAYRILDHLSMV